MIGETLGSYRITGKLGEGGMGVVYTAEHPLIGRKAAVKRLLPEYSNNKAVVDRFFNEARAAAMIQHGGIVQIFDFGYAGDGSAYIVMEFLAGESLTARIAKRRRLPEDQVYRFGRQAASALSAAHEAGIIHRDLKPDNLHLVPDREVPGGERVKVLDFGIAKLVGDQSGAGKTRTGTMMGSPLYMSPEQCRGAGSVDERADVYSLGCVMYHMAAGRPPFDAEGIGEVIAKHIYEQPQSPRVHAPELSASLESIILCAVAKQPDERFSSMKALMKAIDDASKGRFATATDPRVNTPAAGVPVLAPTVAPGTAPPAATTLSSSAAEIAVPGVTVEPAAPGRRRTPWIAAVAVVLVGGAAAAFALRGGDDDGSDTSEAAIAAAGPAAAPDASPEPAVEPAVPVEPAQPAQPETVTVAIDSAPSGATVYTVATGVKIGTTPFEESYDRADGELVVVLRSRGYEPKQVSIPLAEDSRRVIELEKKQRRTRRKRAEPIERKPSPPPPPAETQTTKKKDKKEKKSWGDTINPLDE